MEPRRGGKKMHRGQKSKKNLKRLRLKNRRDSIAIKTVEWDKDLLKAISRSSGKCMRNLQITVLELVVDLEYSIDSGVTWKDYKLPRKRMSKK
jgi:hypothetical protein